MNIETELLNKLFLKRTKKSKNRTTPRVSITSYFSAMHLIHMSNKIQNIPNYKERYDIVEKYEFIEIGKINKKGIEYLPINEKFVLLEYSNQTIPFNTFLFQLPSVSLFIYYVLDSYLYLLNTFRELENICFFDLSTEKIEFNEKYKPILVNFENSFEKGSLTRLLERKTDFTYSPLEVHVLFFLIRNEVETLTLDMIHSISKHFISQNFNQSTKILEQYTTLLEQCTKTLEQYVNQPKKIIVKDILSHENTWDHYSMSILYLHIIQKISDFFAPEQIPFIKELISLLNKNIDPDPHLRETIENTLNKVAELYKIHDDWIFIKKWNKMDVKELYETM